MPLRLQSANLVYTFCEIGIQIAHFWQLAISHLTLYAQKNSAFTATHTTPAGHAIATASFQLFATTPFRLRQHQPTNARIMLIHPRIPVPYLREGEMAMELDMESASRPRTDLSFALAADDQSFVVSKRGMVTRRWG